MKHIFLLLLFAPLARAAAQDDCCCCDFRQKGQTEYNAGRYQSAIKKWQLGQRCPDAAQCPTLAQLIREAQTHLPKPKPKPAKTTPAKTTPSQPAADQNGDAFWELVKDSEDPKTIQKFLDQYPNSRHAAAASQRIKALTPAVSRPADTPKTNALSAAKAPPGFAYVKGGTFQMGDVFGEGYDSEKPVHTITVSDFYLGKTEVTFDEYDAFCAATGRDKPDDRGWGRGKRPVIYVSWYDAVEYCNWRSAQEGLRPVYAIDKNTKDPNNTSEYDDLKWKVSADRSANGYRLPTEAEWEYAARAVSTPEGPRGGGKVRFGNGRDLADPSQINFDATSASTYSVAGEFRQQTVPVGSLNAPNALGLHDLSGNVWEWCYDWYDENYYAQSDGATNPAGAGGGKYAVLRGGSWYFNVQDCRVARRFWNFRSFRNNLYGFRLARGG